MGYQKLAGGAVVLTILVIAAIAIPHGSVDAALVFSIILFAVACALPIMAPRLLTGAGRTNSGSLSTIGLSGVNFGIFFILSTLTLLLGLLSAARSYVWISFVASLGWLVASALLTRAGVAYIDRTFETTSSEISRAELLAELAKIAAITDEPLKSELALLSDETRFSPNDTMIEVAENGEMLTLIKGELSTSTRSKNEDDFRRAVRTLRELLNQRNARLNAMRTKA